MALSKTSKKQPLSVYKKIEAHPKMDEIMTNFLMGKYDYEEVAELFGVEKGDVFDYLMTASKRFKQRELLVADVPQLLSVLRSVVIDVRSRTQDWLNQPISYDNYKPVATMVKELRNIIKDIADIEAKMSEVPKQQIEVLQLQLDELMRYVGTNLCDECKLKIADYLLNDFARKARIIEADYVVEE